MGLTAPAPGCRLRPATNVRPHQMPPSAEPKPVHVGVGILAIQDRLVLLGKRKGALGNGTWAAPGGKLEFGEGIEACARRELREETGLAASSMELGPYTNDVYPEAGLHYVTIFVVARGLKGAPRNLEPEKCEGWAWFAWENLPSPLFKPLQSLLAIGWRPGGA